MRDSAAPSRAAAAENPITRLQKDTTAPVSASPTLPLLVDARALREAFRDTTLAEAAAVPPIAQSVDEFLGAPLCESPPPCSTWPEATAGGGATCAAPRSPKGTASSKKLLKTAHEPMGGVMLLGAGLRPLLSGSSVLQGPNPVISTAIVRENAPSQAVAADTVASISAEEEDSLVAGSAVEPYFSVDMLPSPVAELPSVAPQAAQPDEVPPESPRASVASSVADHPAALEVSRCEVALQTDFPSRGCAAVGFDREFNASATEDRFVLLQRCDPRQVDFTSWAPIPKPEIQLSSEERYLTHVRSRFPGTIKGSSPLAAKNSGKERPVSRRLEELRFALAAHRRLVTASSAAEW